MKTPHSFAAGLHDRFLDGELDLAGRRLLAEHRRSCPACDQSFAHLERLVLALGTLERPLPPAGFAERVLADVRPAALPVWARWRIDSVWGRAAALALLVAGGLGLLIGTLFIAPIVGDAGSVALLFRGPGLVGEGIVAVLRQLDPFRAVTDLISLLGGVLLNAAGKPEVLWALTGSALLSASALVQLSKLLTAPERRRSSHA
jgi:predicted anti-sigma-YlaC factor YlaD